MTTLLRKTLPYDPGEVVCDDPGSPAVPAVYDRVCETTIVADYSTKSYGYWYPQGPGEPYHSNVEALLLLPEVAGEDELTPGAIFWLVRPPDVVYQGGFTPWTWCDDGVYMDWTGETNFTYPISYKLMDGHYVSTQYDEDIPYERLCADGSVVEQTTCTLVLVSPGIPEIPPSGCSAPDAPDPNYAWDSGARSIESLVEDGSVSFRIPATVGGVIVGFAADDPDGAYANITHGLLFQGGLVGVIESGDVVVEPTTAYTNTNVFTIARTNGIVTYHME